MEESLEEKVEPIKILTFGLPKILRGIVTESFSNQGVLNVLGHYDSVTEYKYQQDNHEQPSVIIVNSKQTDQCPEVLYQYPRARVVSIETQGKYLSVWRMVPEKKDLGEISSDELAEVVCSFESEHN